MIAQGRLVGVLFAESAESFAFGHTEEAVLSIVAATLALALDRAEAERGEAPAAEAPDPTRAVATATCIPPPVHAAEGK